MLCSEMIERIREKFFMKLDEKTDWGKLQIMQAYNEAITEGLIEFADKIIEKEEWMKFDNKIMFE